MERKALRSTMPRSEMVVHTIYRILYAFHGERRTVLKFFTVVLRSTAYINRFPLLAGIRYSTQVVCISLTSTHDWNHSVRVIRRL